MANDVIYPNDVTVSDAEHTALARLGLHPENGVPKTDVEPFVSETRDAQAAVVEAAQAETAPSSAELDERTEQSPTWDGSERRNGTDRRVIDAEYDGEDKRLAESDRRAEPPAKTVVDETVAEQPPAENAAAIGDSAPEEVSAEQAASRERDQQAAQDGQVENADGNIESAFPVSETVPAQEPQSEVAPADENLNPPIPATQVAPEPTVPGTPPNIAAHGESAAQPSGEDPQAKS